MSPSLVFHVPAVLASLTLRIVAYLHLRWIPLHIGAEIVVTAFVVHVSALLAFGFLHSPASRLKKITTRSRVRDASRRRSESVSEIFSTSSALDEAKSSDILLRLLSQASRVCRRYWSHTVFGSPSHRSDYPNLVNVSINLLLMAMVLDMNFRAPLYYPSRDLTFTRVGYVSDREANILARDPLETSHLELRYRQIDGFSGMRGSLPSHYQWQTSWSNSSLGLASDYTQSWRLTGLKPTTRYEYVLSNNQTGVFTTAVKPGKLDKITKRFTFLATSCIKPRFPYNPTSHPLHIVGFKHLSSYLRTITPSFMMFLGDFIYVDVPHRFGTSEEVYRRDYRQVYSSPEWNSVSKNLPWLHVIDDHEIDNDWDKNTTHPFTNAIGAFDVYHGSVNPPSRQGETWNSFVQGPASFFMMDSRRYRTSEKEHPPRSPEKSLLGPRQLEAVLDWIATPVPKGVKWKFLVSSVPFTVNWRIKIKDTWANYLYERRVLLEAMWDALSHNGNGVSFVILSGDRHEFAATAFPSPANLTRWPRQVQVHEFSTSPLSMFYLPVSSMWEQNGPSNPYIKDGSGDVNGATIAERAGTEDDVLIKYERAGNSKFGVIDIEEGDDGEASKLGFTLVVDGKEKWKYNLPALKRYF